MRSELDPLSEDDFEVSVRHDAVEYSANRRNHAQREATRRTNKTRRDQGRQRIKGYPDRSANPARRGGMAIAQTSYPSGSEEDSDWISGSSSKNRSKRLQVADVFEYEGQVFLPFDPLYRLAGMESGTSPAKHIASNKALSGLQSETADQGMTPSASSQQDTAHPLLSNAENSPQDEDRLLTEDDEYIEEGEEIFLPGMAFTSSVGERSDIRETKPAETVEEGGYSDDDLFAAMSNKSQSVPTRSDLEIDPASHDSLRDSNINPDDVPLFKPNLYNEKLEGVIGTPLYLDDGLDVKVPAPLNRFLKTYQQQGVRFFYKKYAEGRGAILGDDMGLGKTIQVIAFLSAIMRKTGTIADHMRRKKLIRGQDVPIRPKHWPTALIVCPKFLLRNWARELETWGYFEVEVWQTETWASTKKTFERGYLDIILASYESTRIHIEQLRDMPFSVIVADEAHRLKEPRSAITLAMKKLQCLSCFALSGTIIQNRLDEMWSILDFVDRGWAGTLAQWRAFVVNPIKKGHRHEGTVREVVTAIMRLGIMHEKVLPHFYLRRDKRLIANELPDKRDLVVFCPLADNQIEAYRRFIASEDVQFILKRNDPCSCGSTKKRSQCCHNETAQGETLRDVLLKSINALSKVANHLGLLYHARDDSQQTREVNERIFRQAIGIEYNQKRQNVAAAAMDPDNCGKWKLLAELLKQWRGEDTDNKVLIFSNSVRLLKMVAEFISTDLSYPFEMLTGEVDIDDRMRMIDRFQDPSLDQYLLLISTMAGGVGLNLTASSYSTLHGVCSHRVPKLISDPANDLQAMDRAFRLGQKRTVDVYRLIGQGTLEELMYERQIQKQQRSRQLNEGTFESRIHQGIDRGRTVEEQGELFGTQNIFKFDPKGFVPGRLQRVRQAEDRFVQDLIAAEYEEEDALEEEMADEGGRRLRDARRHRDQAKAVESARRRRDDNMVVQTILGQNDGQESRKEDDVLRSFGINSQIHDTAFRDSPEERKIYELGLKLLKTNPEIASTLKANDLGKIGQTRVKEKKELAKARKETDPEEEPWKDRIALSRDRKRTAALAELSD